MRVTRSARKHRVGVAHILAALNRASEPTELHGGALLYIAEDDRGIELEIVVVANDKGAGFAVIHAMPTSYRKGGRRDD